MVVNVQKHNRAIHVMTMLLVGFGFLMVFVQKYGRSALTAAFMLVSVSLSLYFLINSRGIVVTIAIAIIGGLAVGRTLSIFGRRTEAYVDSEEFILE